MSVFTTGWEVGDDSHYEDLGWTFQGAPTTLTNTSGEFHGSFAGRGGTWALNVDDGAQSPLFGSGGRWLHFWMSPVTANTFSVIFNNSSENNNATVEFYTNGIVTVLRGGANGSFVADGVFNPTVPHWIAIEMVCENSPSGLCNVYVDDVQVISVSGEDLQNTGIAGWEQVFWDGINLNVQIDDIIVTTVGEGRLPEHFAELMIPDGNDVINSEATSTGGAGDYTNVDEVPPDDGTSYNDFTTANSDRYTTGNLGYSPANIHCVTVMNKARDGDGLGTGQTICATDTGGGGVTEALGTAFTLSTSYDSWQDSFNVDPDTGSAWTASGLDDLRIGVNFSA